MAKDDARELLKQLGRKPAQALVVSELLESLMSVWGGPAAFAKSFYGEFVASKKGGVVRARMLDSVTRLFQHHTTNLKGNQPTPDSYSDEELRAAVQELLPPSPPAPRPEAANDAAPPG